MLRRIRAALRESREKRARAKREEHILRTCGCICYCPECRGILQDTHVDCFSHSSQVVYTCNCGAVSAWMFSTPVPVLLKPKEPPNEVDD